LVVRPGRDITFQGLTNFDVYEVIETEQGDDMRKNCTVKFVLSRWEESSRATQ
jgi:hypothetical protein